jgi:hypothetical protein
MTARIFSPAKTATQSGRAKTGEWVLEYEPQSPRRIEPLMGYTSSTDTLAQVRMNFASADEAVAWCERNGVAYTLAPQQTMRRRRVTYSDNFAWTRKTPWTH